MTSENSNTAEDVSPAQKHALVTGGAGFIGGHLCRELLRRGYRVTVLDDLSTGRAENLHGLIGSGKVTFQRGSVCNEADVQRALDDTPDVIVHLAAAVGVRLIVEQPVTSMETNIKGTEIVLQRAAERNIKTLIASSSEVYGKGAAVPFSEDDDLLLGPTAHPRWSYACSKMIDEFLALAYYRDQQLPVVIMRFFNTVGPGQSGQYGMVIPRLVRQALNNEPITVYGDGQQSRAFCHVADTVKMIANLAESAETNGKIFNVGNDEEISIGELAELILQKTESKSTISKIPFDQAYHPGFEDLQRRVPNLQRIQELLKFKPSYGIDDILQHVIEFEKSQQPS
jgi:UDP-glucose 4-epimerase